MPYANDQKISLHETCWKYNQSGASVQIDNIAQIGNAIPNKAI